MSSLFSIRNPLNYFIYTALQFYEFIFSPLANPLDIFLAVTVAVYGTYVVQYLIKVSTVSLVREVKKIQFHSSKAQELLKLITSHALNDTSFVELRERLNIFLQWLDDYRDTIWDSARQDTVSADKINAVVAKRVDRFNEVAANISEIKARAMDEISEAINKVAIAKTEKILNMFDDFKVIH